MKKNEAKAPVIKEAPNPPYKKRNVWLEGDRDEIMDFAKGYMAFLKEGKTERLVAERLEEAARQREFADLKSCKALEPGQPFYYNHRGKSFFMGVVKASLDQGFRILGAHIDAPRLDLKPQPLYEAEGLALFKTHYYGGIKKYQWVTMPLSLMGVIYRKDGSLLSVNIGEDEGDPVFTITDLLPHLAQEQMQKTAGKAIEGEKLNVLAGSIPAPGEEGKDPSVKKAILDILYEKYGLLEEDFLRGELELVPNFPPREVGFDRSLIGAYGQDDRICAYAAKEAFLDLDARESGNVLAVFFDKEEIGSNGDTGAQSRILEHLMELLIRKLGDKEASPLEIFFASKALSADVSAVEDPSYDGVFDPYNRGQISYGPILSKYSGSRGKYDANDASAEFLSHITGKLDRKGVLYQFGELGKVDLGGGGTIGMFLSQLGIETVDLGTGLLSMHSPYEVASKADLYMTYRAYKAFLED